MLYEQVIGNKCVFAELNLYGYSILDKVGLVLAEDRRFSGAFNLRFLFLLRQR